jgi:hypothetical protein
LCASQRLRQQHSAFVTDADALQQQHLQLQGLRKPPQ